jgi:hypothetical protein
VPRTRGQTHGDAAVPPSRGRKTHDGPFDVRDIRHVFESDGFVVVAGGAEDEFLIYEHPDGRTAMLNPSWPPVRMGDPVFKTLARDLGIRDRDLRRRLSGVQG